MTCIKHLANSNLLKMSIKRLESVVLIRIIRHCEMAEESVHGILLRTKTHSGYLLLKCLPTGTRALRQTRVHAVCALTEPVPLTESNGRGKG